jgi:uncharacterized membrane protein
MSIAWHYMKNGVQTGPATADEIKALITSGTIKADTLVWREGLPSWVAVSTQADFAGVVPPAAPPPPPAPVGAAGGPGVFTPDAADVEQNKVFAVLSYLPPLLFLVPLLAVRQSKFAMYHCNQGLVLTLAAFVVSIANMILDRILIFIPFLGLLLMSILSLGIFIGIIALVIMGIINAANGVCKPLPVIGNRFTLVK